MKTLPAATLVMLSCAALAAQQDQAPRAPDHRGSAPRFRYANRPDAVRPYGEVTIYKDVFAEPLAFRGAGRDEPEPIVDRVKIGFIGPLVASDAPVLAPGQRPMISTEAKTVFGRHLLQGAMLAIEDANGEGGYKGIPFELVRRTDLVQWGQTSNELVKFAYEDHVWSVLSSVDSNHNHVLSRATLKAEVPIVNAGSTDPTLTEHAIPWLVRCINDDRLNAYELLNYLYRVKKYQRVVVLRVNDRDGRVGIMDFNKGARRLGHPVMMELRFRNGDLDFSEPLRRLATLQPEAIVIWANPAEGAKIVRQMRTLGMKQEPVGFDRLAHPLFIEAAGPAAEGMVVASTYNPDRPEPRAVSFEKRYTTRFRAPPDTYAAHGYDGCRIIIEAIRRAGLNRPKIRDAMFAMRRYSGVSGDIDFDFTLNSVTRPWLARIEHGRLQYFRPPDWERVTEPRAVLAARPARW
jgi:branched-chain amino acid transport system substrate-binding protein